jgi:hypothetical protein
MLKGPLKRLDALRRYNQTRMNRLVEKLDEIDYRRKKFYEARDNLVWWTNKSRDNLALWYGCYGYKEKAQRLESFYWYGGLPFLFEDRPSAEKVAWARKILEAAHDT